MKHITVIPDYQQTWKIEHKLSDILLPRNQCVFNNECFLQLKTAEKSNEITVMHDLLDIKGKVNTTDAMLF
ncbi:hypothetical protein QT13_16415 [Pectobacterium brasiliense]|nr:DDE transposase family protein [Pectobacterium brasiliense]KHS66643.1 hypothetical protein QT13_16415 [Pectobacterium brasiliense]